MCKAASFQHPGGVSALAFSPDGKTLLTGGSDGTARLWDAESGRSLGSPMAHPQEVTSVAFSPDGSLALTGCLDRAARVWDVTTGVVVGQPLAHPGEVLAVAFGADGATLVTGQGRAEGDGRLWDLAPGGLLGGPMVHAASVVAVGFSPDSRRVATAGRDNAARLWDAATAEPVGDALPHNREVNTLAFSPDSQTLVTGGDDEGRFWQAADGAPVLRESKTFTGIIGKKQVLQASVGAGERSGFSPGHPAWKERSKKPDAQPVWGPARGKKGTSRQNETPVYALAFGPDGTRLAAGGPAGATLYALGKGDVFASTQLAIKDDMAPVVLPDSVRPVNALAFSPDGRLVATAGEDGQVQVWDTTTFDAQRFEARIRGVTDVREYFRLSDEFLKVKPVGGLLRLEGEVAALAFSLDGRQLLAGGADSAARLWDLSTGQVRLLGHQGPVVALAFRPDGRECVTGSWDGTARLWDAATGEQIGQPLEHQGKVLAVAFSADGDLMLTGGEDHTARLWDAATGKPVGPSLRQRDQIRAVAFRPDGGTAVTAGDDGAARLWATPAAMKGDIDRVRLGAEAWTGQTREMDGSVRFLEAAGWRNRRKASAGSEPADPAAIALARCRRQAREAEATGRWYAARWNLDRLVAAEPNNASHRVRRGAAAQELHDLAGAGADYDAAVNLVPGDWQARFRRGQLAILSREWQQGIDDLSDALERLPRTEDRFDVGPDGRQVSIHFGRGNAQAALGQWKEAAADFEIAQNPFAEPAPAEMWIDEAVVLVKLGDAKRYGALCQGMLAKFANPQEESKSTIVTMEYGRQVVFNYGRPFDPRAAAAMVWVCSLSPDGQPDRNRTLELARKAARSLPNDYPCARALGAALYRAGQEEEAVHQLGTAAALQKSSPSVWLFLAMAHQKGGRGDKAKEWLDKARAWVELAHKPKPEGAAGKSDPSWDDLPWTERAALELLQAEAEKLIEKGPAKP